MESTRSKTEVWLIGQHITEITGAQLPSRGDVLRLFFHGHNEHKKTVNDSASEVAASRNEKKERRGVMAGVDKKIACSIKRREESKSKQSLQQNQASSALEYDELGSSSETESQSSSSSSTSSLAISPVVSSSNRKRATLKVITPELSSTLDRTGISHRSTLRIVSATAASLGHDPMELVLNYE
ncbi:hypothetical protein Hamer_G031769, partial [Homarus americanus]